MGIIYKNNIPYLEEQNLVELANSIKTPFYVYSQKNIRDTFLKLKRVLKSKANISAKELINDYGRICKDLTDDHNIRTQNWLNKYKTQ